MSDQNKRRQKKKLFGSSSNNVRNLKVYQINTWRAQHARGMCQVAPFERVRIEEYVVRECSLCNPVALFLVVFEHLQRSLLSDFPLQTSVLRVGKFSRVFNA